MANLKAEALPSIEECAEQRINHAYTNEYGTIVMRIYTGSGEEDVYARLAGGTAFKSEDKSTDARGVNENTIITEDDFYALYSICGYHFTPKTGGGYECAKLMPAAYSPVCPYCGQSTLPTIEYVSQEEANKWAAEHCNCPEGAQFRAEQKRKAEREKNIARIKDSLETYGAYCESKQIPLTADIKDILFNYAVMAVDGKINGAAVNFGRIKTKIGINAKGAVALTFAYSDSLKTEV